MLRDYKDQLSARFGALPVQEADDATSVGRTRLVEWFQRWRKPIRRWIARNRCVSSAEVDDLTQDVFLRLLRYSDGVLVQDPQGYLFRVASNVVHEWRQRGRVRLPHDDIELEEFPLDGAEEPQSVCEEAASIARVRAAVDRLPKRQRELLWLHIKDEMTYKQIARERGLTYRVVLRDLTRAYASLREQLR